MTAPQEDYGRRLLCHVVDERANSGYSRPFARIAKSLEVKDGFRDVSYRDLANAVDRCAHILDENMPKPGNFTAFGWVANPYDFRYIILILAGMKSQRVPFYPSPRNSMAAHMSLLEATKCDYFLVPDTGTPAIVQKMLDKRPMKVIHLPSVEELLSSNGPTYTFDRTFDEAWNEPALALHTSGSTGIPKPIIVKHLWYTACDALNTIPVDDPDAPALILQSHANQYSAFPSFHAAGVMIMLPCVVYYHNTLIQGPLVPLTAEVVNEMHVTHKPDNSFIPPSIIKELMDVPEYRENVKAVKNVEWGGGALPSEPGDILKELTQPMNCYGITEAGVVTWMISPRDAWDYMSFHKTSGMEFRHLGGDEYESWIVRKPEYQLFQAVFSTFPDIDEWNTKDIWTPHPTLPNFWKHRGRADDIIVFSNGEKLNPTTMQEIIDGDHVIHNALVFGHAHFSAGLLVEPKVPTKDPQERAKLLEQIWPSVIEANKDTVAHGRISKDYIIFTDPEKPFLRAGKGTVQKKMTLQLYESEIEALYKNEEAQASASVGEMDLKNQSSVLKGIRSIVLQQLEIKDVAEDQSLFDLGFDSLMAANLSRAVNSASGKDVIKPSDVYKNSSVNKLVAFLTSSSTGPKISREDQMQKLFDELTEDLPLSARRASASSYASVLLTGSTGSLGSYLLASFLENPAVEKIYCLNRSKGGAERQLKSFEEKGLPTEKLSEVGFLTGDAGKPLFGLTKDEYTELLSNVTHVLHNAWQVNFNLELDSFQPQVRGVRRFVDFSSQSEHGAQILFTSSIATIGSYTEGPSVPEEPLFDWHVSQSMGYGESKHIGEAVLARAGMFGSAPSTVCRVGQITGPVRRKQGEWNRSEWFPSLVASSLLLGALPDSLGFMKRLDWIPVDELADVLVELMLDESLSKAPKAGSSGVNFVHGVNPNATTWEELIPAIVDYAPANNKPAVVSLSEWVSRLQAAAAAPFGSPLSDPAQNPALKLQAFFEEAAQLTTSPDAGKHEPAIIDTTQTKSQSKTMQKLRAPNKDWMHTWLEQWHFAVPVAN